MAGTSQMGWCDDIFNNKGTSLKKRLALVKKIAKRKTAIRKVITIFFGWDVFV